MLHRNKLKCFFPKELYFLKLFGMYVFLSLMFDKCCVKCVFEKKVETSVSSNKITAFCKNENNKQEVEKSPQLFNRQQLFNYGKNESLCGSNKMG